MKRNFVWDYAVFCYLFHSHLFQSSACDALSALGRRVAEFSFV
jgi:hypothetical protein